MNHLRVVPLLVMFLGVVVNFNAAGAVIDNFQEYTNASYIQSQQGTNGTWSRSGNAVADGLYSTGTGEAGDSRSALANASFSTSAPTTVYRSKFAFGSVYDLSNSGSCTISLDIYVGSATILPNLQVACVIGDTSAAAYETPFASLSTDSTFATFNFVFATGAGDTNVGSAGDSLATILKQDSYIQFVFQDTADTGSQNIYFTNLEDLTAVPEPSAGMLLLNVLGGIAFLRILQCFVSKNRGY